jgi:cellulose biosynthesis protein BcsQ
MVVVVAQQKGGVGKTTTAANVGVLLARAKGRVLLVDSDPQSSLTRQLGLEDRPRISLVDVLAGRSVASDAIVCDVHGALVKRGGQTGAPVCRPRTSTFEYARHQWIRMGSP